jgi:hypothetical protein
MKGFTIFDVCNDEYEGGLDGGDNALELAKSADKSFNFINYERNDDASDSRDDCEDGVVQCDDNVGKARFNGWDYFRGDV